MPGDGVLFDNRAALRRAHGRRRLTGIVIGLILIVIGALAIEIVAMQRPPARRHNVPLRPLPPPPPLPEQTLLSIAPDAARIENAATPLADPAPAPARPFRFAGDAASRARAIDCLAAAAWYEAGDDTVGERAVIQTVLNRARNPPFPSSICGVVFQGSERATGCQFTFSCDGALARTPSGVAWARAQIIARAAVAGAVDPAVGYATHYHADYVVPYWQASLDKIATVGPHIFYRWPGFWGTPAAFRRGLSGVEPFVAALERLSAAHRIVDASAPLIAAPVPASTASPVGNATPLVVAGVSETALRGNTVQAASGDQQIFYLKLDPAAFPGSYATTSLALCREKPECRVLGWRDPRLVAASLPLSRPARDGLSFLYVKNRRFGVERVLWNCEQMARPDPQQCLGTGDGAADGLIP